MTADFLTKNLPGTYVSVLATGGGEGCSFKIRPTHKLIDDTLIQPKFVL